MHIYRFGFTWGL